MSEIMKNKEVRILLPLEHRYEFRAEEERRWRREIVVTTYKVIDPLGLESDATFRSQSTTSDGGSCGYSPSLGVLQPVTTLSGDTRSMPQTSTCAQSNDAFAAEYQIEKSERIIPDYESCYLSDTAGELSLVTEFNPNCEYYSHEGNLSLWRDFEDRMTHAISATEYHPGRVFMTPWDDRNITPDAGLTFPIDLRRIIGKPILSKVGEDGIHSVWILVEEDFNQFLPDVVRMNIEPDKVNSWLMPRVGINDLFYVDQDDKAIFVETPNSIDPVLFKNITGKTFQSDCDVELQDNTDECVEAGRFFRTALRTLYRSNVNEDVLTAVWERLPASSVTSTQRSSSR